jgi:flagellar L-ring protein precursor FlgH
VKDIHTMKHALAIAGLLAVLGAPADASLRYDTQGRPGSIYVPSAGPRGMIADKTARRPGDLITVVIEETSDIKNEEKSNLTKATNLNYSLDVFDINPDTFSTLPALGGSSQDDLTSSANYEKKGNFSARITAIVVDVLPNGTLVIEGRREVRVDNETKVIEFSGIVRRFDIQPNNTIESELVAQARVSYVGTGHMTEATNRTGIGSVIHSAISWLWPF